MFPDFDDNTRELGVAFVAALVAHLNWSAAGEVFDQGLQEGRLSSFEFGTYSAVEGHSRSVDIEV